MIITVSIALILIIVSIVMYVDKIRRSVPLIVLLIIILLLLFNVAGCDIICDNSINNTYYYNKCLINLG
jgi:hypothetical protein